MLKRISISKRPVDPNQLAYQVVQESTGQQREKNPAAVALGRLGGVKGGLARAASLSPARRKQIAKKAAQTRWNKKTAE
jgi:hypothetical protein